MTFTPWAAEPYDGFKNFRYMVRMSDEDGRGIAGRMWPKAGYVQCDRWNRGPIDRNRGLFGFLDANSQFLPEFVCFSQGYTFQVLVVDVREGVAPSYPESPQKAGAEFAVARCWVKYNGELVSVVASICSEGNAYTDAVANNILKAVEYSEQFIAETSAPPDAVLSPTRPSGVELVGMFVGILLATRPQND